MLSFNGSISELMQFELKALLLFKLMRKRKWGHAHIAFDKVVRWLPGHLRGAAKELITDLIREGFVLSKPTSYGLEISLNPRRASEIKEFVDKYGP